MDGLYNDAFFGSAKTDEGYRKRLRGCELPGTFNPLLITELFHEQSQPWESIITSTRNSILEAVDWSTRSIIQRVAVDEIVQSLLQTIGAARSLRPTLLVADLEKRVEVDMEIFASELAADYMQAYYKVGLEEIGPSCSCANANAR